MVPRPVLELAGGCGRLSGELSAQSIQALVDSQSLSSFIHHPDLHDQMGWQAIQLEGVHGNAFTADFFQHAGERRQERTLSEGQLRDYLAGSVGSRDEPATNRFGERSDQSGDLLFQVSGHEPVNLRMRNLIDRGLRHRHRDAILIVARLESILQGKSRLVNGHRIGILNCGILGIAVAEQIFAAHVEHGGAARRLAEPCATGAAGR